MNLLDREVDDSDFDFGTFKDVRDAKGLSRTAVQHDMNVTKQMSDTVNVGTGSLAERLELERHMRTLIGEGIHGFKFIQSYLISTGYQNDEILRAFKKLTGLDANEFMDPTSYIQSPNTIPGLTAAWGVSKDSKYDYYFINPWTTGWAVFGQKGDLQRDVVETCATRKIAYDTIKSLVKELNSYDRIITKEMSKDYKPEAEHIDMTNAISLSAAVENAMQVCQSQGYDRENKKRLFAGLLMDNKINQAEHDFLHLWAAQEEGINVTATDTLPLNEDKAKEDTGIIDTMFESEDEVRNIPFEQEEKEITPQEFFDSDKDPAPDQSISENIKKIMEYIENKNEELGDFKLFFRKMKYHSKEVSEQVEKSLNISTQDMEDFFSANAIASVMVDIKDTTLTEDINKKPGLLVFLIINNQTIIDDTFKGKDERIYSLTHDGCIKYFFKERESAKGLGGI